MSRKIIWLGLTAATALAGAISPSFGQEQQEVDKQQAALTNDGPHIYWRSESEGVVFYACHGELLTAKLDMDNVPENELRAFDGQCADSSVKYAVSPVAPQPQPFNHDRVSKLFAVSDIHGEFDAFVQLLVNAGIVDKELNWDWGNGHLVVLGDVFDRGDKVTECLWLIHRLEREARREGGRVHYLLGNHELMALQGDLRYVNKKYLEGPISSAGISYDDVFGPETELGRWLRTKHTAITLNNILFVHAGFGAAVVDRDLSIEEINEQARKGIDLRDYALVLDDMPGFLFESAGPLWYRGYYIPSEGSYDQATTEDVERILDHFDADAVVVGHTDIGIVQSLHNGKVFGIDVSLDKLGSLQGLLWEEGVFYRVTGTGEKQPFDGIYGIDRSDPDGGS